MTIAELIINPFLDFAFMRRALAACVVLSVGGTPLGVFMTFRRMTLVGDAISHAILPGVALAFMVSGLSVWPMTAGGVLMGLGVGLIATALVRFTKIKEDAAFTMLYLLSLAAGVTMISIKGSSVDLLHLLFGNILFINADSLVLVAVSTCLSLFVIAAFYRRLVIDCFDPDFLKAAGSRGGWISFVFFGLLMINLIAAFQALGTLMALGLMVIPAIAAKFWTRNIDVTLGLGVLFAIISSCLGLLASYHWNVPSGPAVVLTAGVVGIFSALVGRCGSACAYVFNWE